MSKKRSHSSYAKKNPDKMKDRGFGIKMTDEEWEYVMRPFNFFRNLNKIYEEEDDENN